MGRGMEERSGRSRTWRGAVVVEQRSAVRGHGAGSCVGELIPAFAASGGTFSSEGHSALLFCTPDYSRPRPSRYSGYHRYQFRLYRQPTHQNISLSPEEQDSLGKDPPSPPSPPRGAFPGLWITLRALAGWGCPLGAKGSLEGTWVRC